MRSFWINNYGSPLEIIFSLIENGRWRYYEGELMGVEFNYPSPEDDNEIRINMTDLEDLDKNVLSALVEKLGLEMPTFEYDSEEEEERGFTIYLQD